MPHDIPLRTEQPNSNQGLMESFANIALFDGLLLQWWNLKYSTKLRKKPSQYVMCLNIEFRKPAH